jgi:hypothetical protein
MRFSQQGAAAKKGMHAFFFYANCYHEVEELTSGARLVGPCKFKPVLNAPGSPRNRLHYAAFQISPEVGSHSRVWAFH